MSWTVFLCLAPYSRQTSIDQKLFWCKRYCWRKTIAAPYSPAFLPFCEASSSDRAAPIHTGPRPSTPLSLTHSPVPPTPLYLYPTECVVVVVCKEVLLLQIYNKLKQMDVEGQELPFKIAACSQYEWQMACMLTCTSVLTY